VGNLWIDVDKMGGVEKLWITLLIIHNFSTAFIPISPCALLLYPHIHSPYYYYYYLKIISII